MIVLRFIILLLFLLSYPNFLFAFDFYPFNSHCSESQQPSIGQSISVLLQGGVWKEVKVKSITRITNEFGSESCRVQTDPSIPKSHFYVKSDIAARLENELPASRPLTDQEKEMLHKILSGNGIDITKGFAKILAADINKDSITDYVFSVNTHGSVWGNFGIIFSAKEENKSRVFYRLQILRGMLTRSDFEVFYLDPAKTPLIFTENCGSESDNCATIIFQWQGTTFKKVGERPF